MYTPVRGIVFTLAIGLVCLGPAVVDADEVSEAKDHYKKGTKAFELGSYDEAVAEYAAAYRLRDDPALLYNLGQAHRLANHPADALRFYRLFLMKVPNAQNRSEVEAKIDELQRLVEQQKKTQNMPPDSVKTPGSTPATTQQTPTPEPLPTTTTVEHRAEPGTALYASTMRRSARSKRTAGASVAGVGLALVVGGIVTGVLAHNAGNKLTSLNNNMQTFDYNEQQAGKTDQLLEGVLLGIGAAAVVVGGTLYLLGHREQRRARQLSFAPSVGRDTLRVSLEAAF